MASPIARVPKRGWSWLNYLWGYVNRHLIVLSGYYCRWRNIEAPKYSGWRIHPFGLLIKDCRTGSDVEREAHGTMVARAMGLPVPRIIGYSNKGDKWIRQTILMTKIPGQPLSGVYNSYSEEQLNVIMAEVGACLDRMHSFASPHGTAICGLKGDDILNSVLPLGKFARTESPESFHESINLWPTDPKTNHYDHYVRTAKQLEGKDYQVVFGHGDLAPWNIMVKDGHLTGIIDWEFAGWYPKYWDYVNPLSCYDPDRDWAKDLSCRIPGCEKYVQEWHAWDALSVLLASWLD